MYSIALQAAKHFILYTFQGVAKQSKAFVPCSEFDFILYKQSKALQVAKHLILYTLQRLQSKAKHLGLALYLQSIALQAAKRFILYSLERLQRRAKQRRAHDDGVF